ncbi:MAG: hypothetical protein ACPGWR_18755, partial [Ardenticatenaceae bacterium]
NRPKCAAPRNGEVIFPSLLILPKNEQARLLILPKNEQARLLILPKMNKQGCLFYQRMNKQGCVFYLKSWRGVGSTEIENLCAASPPRGHPAGKSVRSLP